MTDQSDDEDPRYRVITLSAGPPVRIRQDEWPVIAVERSHPREYHPHVRRVHDPRARALRKRWLFVRRHADGRTLVYGGTDTIWDVRIMRAGELVPASDVAGAITRVARDIGGSAQFARDAIARLPPVEL